jgi:hypothetical protein
VGRVGSAVMLTSKLRKRQQMVQVVQVTRSLGHRIDPPLDANESEAESRKTLATSERETWAWTDDGDVQVHVVFLKGRVESWTLRRPEESAAVMAGGPPGDTSSLMAP